MRKIILVGYMAVGKTTIANLLAEKLNFRAVDLDKVIESKIGLSITEIFEQRGEIYFRKMEHQIFKDILESNENNIVSTGGGTPCYAGNHLLLKGENNASIYLKASIDTILERLASSRIGRPIVANKTDEELQEFVAKHLFERSFYYNQAQYTVTVDHKNSDAITEEIIKLLN